MKKQIPKLLLIILLFFAYKLRSYGIDWDQGFHLHPDERMLIMVADRINFFKNLNPDFFNYGSLPIYLLKSTAQVVDFLFNKNLANYDGMLKVGRNLSVFFDLFTLVFIYKISRLLFKNEKVAIFSSFFYTITFFAIQNTHFFVVDVLLTTFTTILIYLLLILLLQGANNNERRSNLILLSSIGIIFAAMMSTKFTSIIFYPFILLVMFYKNWGQWKNLFFCILTFHLSLIAFHYLFMPYAFIEQARFLHDIKEQLKMNSNPYIFPYTLQYVGSLPYLYYLKNIFLWGLGPFISLFAIIGFYKFVKLKIENSLKIENWKLKIIFMSLYLFYFIVVGQSSVKFMRYMLPLYPFFSILAGFGLYALIQKSKVKSQKLNSKFKNIFTFNFLLTLLPFAFCLFTLLWTLMFVNIYSVEHTRITASKWIEKNIPAGATIATEHWDDGMPLYGGENYKHEELTLYDQPDNENKWLVMNEKLKNSDYIIIASNRLYVPLQKLSDCRKYQSCFSKTSEYYKKLFSNQLSFKKVAEFSAYPKFQILNFKFQIIDDLADESFTVYDHPKIMIYKNTD